MSFNFDFHKNCVCNGRGKCNNCFKIMKEDPFMCACCFEIHSCKKKNTCKDCNNIVCDINCCVKCQKCFCGKHKDGINQDGFHCSDCFSFEITEKDDITTDSDSDD